MTRIIQSFGSIIFALGILLTGCDLNSTFQNKDTQPSLSSEKMVNILADMQLAEAVTKDNILKRDSFKFETIEQYYSTILNIHEVSQESFDQTMQHYIAHPEELEKVYTDVEEKIRAFSKPTTTKSKPKTKFKEKLK